ncbi:class II aldolase/adducin family protein [Deinococcus sp. YIM 134068]|uniref:class II aldolase/adducin family protein n=1 Tax=Deinococcus lichenicola TaxID=3118910 RepID=UPI002F944254
MPLPEPFPELDELITSIGEAGHRVAAMDASEGGAGNLSVCLGWPVEVRRRFPNGEDFTLPQPAPNLAGRVVLVTGSGRRLRDIRQDPEANLAAVVMGEDGRTARLYTSPRRLFERVTSEFNSHLAVHDDQVGRSGTNFHAVVHAQPPHLTYLSHIAAYRDIRTLNEKLLRWQPETIVNLPEGVGVLPFILPGSPALMAANIEALREHRVVLWSKHGVMARSDVSITRAVDRVEYAETAAKYEHLDLTSGGKGEGLSRDELREVVEAFGVPTKLI